MKKLESMQAAEPAFDRLASLRRERESRRRRARLFSGLLLALGLGFVAQGFVRDHQAPSLRETQLRSHPPAAEPRTVDNRPAQPQVVAHPVKLR
ncbi:MAG: hypothetical protein ACK4F7_02625 [Inhella sp.]